MNSTHLAVRRIILIAVITAIMETAKQVLNPLPNVELVTLLVILFTKQFGWRITLPSVLIFATLECMWWGFGTWSAVYYYMWPLLVLIVHLLRKQEGVMPWAVISAAFGLAFGALCSIFTLVTAGWAAAVAWWIAGIPYDLIHCASNFLLCLVLYKPLKKALDMISSGSSLKA